jgi:hypothetical protein
MNPEKEQKCEWMGIPCELRENKWKSKRSQKDLKAFFQQNVNKVISPTTKQDGMLGPFELYGELSMRYNAKILMTV